MIDAVVFKNDSGDRPRVLFYITKKTSSSKIVDMVTKSVGDDYDKTTDTLYGEWWFQPVKHIDEL